MRTLKNTVIGVVAGLFIAGSVMGYSSDQAQVDINWDVNQWVEIALGSQTPDASPISLEVSHFDETLVWGENVAGDELIAESNAPYDISVVANGHLAEGLTFAVADIPSLADGEEESYSDFKDRVYSAGTLVEWDVDSLGDESPYVSIDAHKKEIKRSIAYALAADEDAASTYEVAGGVTLTFTIAPQN